MDISVSFTVEQPAARVWDQLQDVPEVIGCVPGLELIEALPDDHYRARMGIKLGPVSAAFEGEGAVTNVDADARTALIEGKGIDKRGGSRAAASAAYRVTEDNGTTTVSVDADVKLTGALAQMGRTGIVQDIANQLTKQFAECLRTKLAAESGTGETEGGTPAQPVAQAAPIHGGSLIAGALWRSIRRFFARVFGRSS